MSGSIESEFQASIYEIVIKSETNSSRFENFCAAAVSKIEGGSAVLTTTTSWDLGRDGVAYGKAAGLYVCCSLRDDPDAKALEDIERLKATTRGIKTLYFCSSQRLSEHRLDQIREALLAEVDHEFEVRCLGAHQFAQLMNGDQKLERFYKAEISNVLTAIDGNAVTENDVRGLRLALMTSSAAESTAIRHAIYQAAILDALADQGATAVGIGKAIGNSLGLSRPLQQRSLLPYLHDLNAQGHISRNSDVYHITDEGKARRSANETSAAEQLMDGRIRIQAALEAAIGAPLISDEFSRIWTVFEEKLANYLYQRGHAIVDEVSAMLDPDSEASGGDSTLSFVDEIAEAVGKTSSSPRRQIELNQAVKDIFSDRTGAAADWLVQTCAGFVAACTMGLENESAQAVGRLLAKTTIVLDTDVVLSLLGLGEPEHEAVRVIIDAWQRNRGRALVAQPVLEEVAYHAWIARTDFAQVTHLLPGSEDDRARMIENAFVRSFAHLLAQKQIRHSNWITFIRQYAGNEQYDYRKVASVLSADFNIQTMPPRSSALADLARRVGEYSLGLAERNHPNRLSKIDRDKATRDAELYTAFLHLFSTLREADPSSSCLLISSGHRLARIEEKFRQTGERQTVVSIAGALLLVSILPDVALGLSAMKSFLFDERRPRFSSEMERTLVRMVRSSNEVSLPWAQRTTLLREVRERLLQNAKSEGIPKADRNLPELEAAALKPENRQNIIVTLKQSLDALAIDTRLERENRELRMQVARLEADKERARGRR
ncbi:hypothetical protein [uncultured Stenotrophomonas sp.]|uniref:hypothetical protein n=1 Tax=uncultured Stenotrophomonas sp. TaxID=165438 RepID=UPI0025DE034F|nr:hypothetical protein [uncultured Stenotrophomonas sp.]